MRRTIVGLASTALLLGGVTAGTAAASWPGCPPDSPGGPCRWCPGDPPVQTGNLKVDPVRWDANICHTYWYVGGGGNVARTIWEGDAPPPPGPPITGLVCDPGTFTNCRIETWHPPGG